MSPLADMLIRQHDSHDDALHHAMIMQTASRGSARHNWQCAAAEIRAAINTSTLTVGTSSEMIEMAHFVTQTEDAKPSGTWNTTGWRSTS